MVAKENGGVPFWCGRDIGAPGVILATRAAGGRALPADPTARPRTRSPANKNAHRRLGGGASGGMAAVQGDGVRRVEGQHLQGHQRALAGGEGGQRPDAGWGPGFGLLTPGGPGK